MHVRNTRSASGIVEAARQTGCDLIVMGSHGYGAIGRVLLGSVATEVLTLSPVPVLIFKSPNA
jgi:nucleotide-binding universal stress UspA family protein